jgi:SAM-dependent methyltransferase
MMIDFPYRWEEFQLLEASEQNSIFEEFLLNFPPKIDFASPSMVPDFRNPLLCYLAENPELFQWYGVNFDHSYLEFLGVLESEIMTGRLNAQDFCNTLDFGVGTGISSILLNRISKKLFAVEMNPNALMFLDQKGILTGQYICRDGMSYMDLQPKATYDLITAFGFGFNKMTDGWMKRFYDSSLRVLKPNGKIMMHSYMHTIVQVREYLGMQYDTRFNPKVIVTTHEGSI